MSFLRHSNVCLMGERKKKTMSINHIKTQRKSETIFKKWSGTDKREKKKDFDWIGWADTVCMYVFNMKLFSCGEMLSV